MITNSEEIGKVSGGVGTYNTKVIKGIDATMAVGDHKLGIYVPANAMVIAAYIKNPGNDTAGAGTLELKLGDESLVAATSGDNLKDKAKGGAMAEGKYVANATEVKLTVAGSALTAGTVEVGILYV